MAPNPDAAPFTTQLSPGLTLAPAQADSAPTSVSSGPATSPVPQTGDSNPGPMFSIQTDTVLPHTIISISGPAVSGSMTTELSPGITLSPDGREPSGINSYPRPSGVITVYTSSVPGLGTLATPTGFSSTNITATDTGSMTIPTETGSMTTQGIGTSSPLTTTGTSNSSIVLSSSVASGDTGVVYTSLGSATGYSGTSTLTMAPTEGGGVLPSTTTGEAGSAVTGDLGTSTQVVVTTPAGSAAASAPARTSATAAGPNAAAAMAPQLDLALGIWGLILCTGFFAHLRA